jgi:hypothetical protein
VPRLAHAALLAIAAGCYHPSPPEGAPCETTAQCPTPQQCRAGVCALHDAVVDAGSPDAAALAADAPPPPVDAAPLPCTTAGLACAGTATTFSCGGMCWVRCTSNVGRDTARAACAGWQGALGEIDDATEEACVTAHLTAASWIGLAQAATATTPQTGWTWNDGAPVSYTRWQVGAPNDRDGHENGEEQCGRIQIDGTWDDMSCGSSLDFLCARP